MVHRSIWKGYLKLALVTCPVALFKATEEPERTKFKWFNRKTGNRVTTAKFDAVTGKAVDTADIANGIDVGAGKFVEISDEEIASAAPKSADVIELGEFVPNDAIGLRHVEDHYFCRPDGAAGEAAFALIHRALALEGVLALAQLTMTTREQLVAIGPCGKGMIVTTLRYSNELRDAADYFAKLAYAAPLPELVALAQKLVTTGTVEFDAGKYKDRYAKAIGDLVKRKIAGEMIKPRTPPSPPRFMDLGEAVRQSVEKINRPARRKSA